MGQALSFFLPRALFSGKWETPALTPPLPLLTEGRARQIPAEAPTGDKAHHTGAWEKNLSAQSPALSMEISSLCLVST